MIFFASSSLLNGQKISFYLIAIQILKCRNNFVHFSRWLGFEIPNLKSSTPENWGVELLITPGIVTRG
ncbi:hypothetical protein EF405_19695 [Cyclobacteriaceae bacterium YHN15]|nr:hypothetical protein EF405_19695 [Cyclobacteriaceae bacterium YHN15]